MKEAKLLWIDLEMTGLDPEKDRILEVAAVATGWELMILGNDAPARSSANSALTDARLARRMLNTTLSDAPVALNSSDDHRGVQAAKSVEKSVEKAEFTEVVKVDEKLMKERMTGEFWEKNDKTRRALMEQNGRGKSAKEVERELLEFMDKWFGKEIILAGNSIHQDRKFIDREWPEVAKRLHYRMLDVSAWKVVMEGRYGKKFVKREEHRALDDIRGSIEELKWYLGMIK